MKTVVLDGYGLNPGDLSWKEIEELTQLTVYDRTPRDLVVERSREADAILTNKTVIDADAIRALPKLKYIGVLATGYNVVDTEAARKAGIAVTNIPAYSTMSVAQNVFALLLEATNHVGHFTSANKDGRWANNPDFCWWDSPLTELAGKNFGIIGFGHIGSAVARIALAFGMKVTAATSKDQSELPEGVEKSDIDGVFRTCDVVSLHCPLTDGTYHLVDSRRLSLMKPDAIVINTGRGPLVDEDALAEALKEKRIRAAGVDVLSSEPPAPGNPLLSAPGCYITPHVSWATTEARIRLMRIAAENLKAFIEGKPRNVVNGI